MSTLVEALSVVIPRHVLDAGYPGGTEGYLETARRARGARYAISDERLACVSFASPADADAFTAPLSALGLGAEEGAPPPIACLDEDFGPTAACPWLRWRRHDDGFTSCWLEWTEPGELAAPQDWLPPRQRSQASRPAAVRPASSTAAPSHSPSDVAPAASTVGQDAPLPFRIVPTAIGPLTPISSPAILAAIEGNSGSNGHALLDADSIDVDSLVATADDAFSEMAYGTAGLEVTDQDIENDWSLPEFKSNDIDAGLVNDQLTGDETISDVGDFSSDADSVDDAEAAHHPAVGEDSVDVQESTVAEEVESMDIASPFDYSPIDREAAAAEDIESMDNASPFDYSTVDHGAVAAEDVVAMDNASPFDYSPAVQELSSGGDLMASHEAAFAEDVAAMEHSSPFDYSRAVQELSASDDLAASQKATFAEDVVAIEDASPFDHSPAVQEAADADDIVSADYVDVVAEETVTFSEEVAVGTEVAASEDNIETDDATGYLADDDISYDDQADVAELVAVVAESSEPAEVHTKIWTDEIDDEPIAAANHQYHESLSWADTSTDAFDDVDASFAALNLDALVNAGDESQSVDSASPDDDATAHTPASLTPVAMTAVSAAPAHFSAAASVSFSNSPLDAVRAHLAERGWRYSQDADQGALFYQTAGGRASYPGFAAADESAQLVWLYTQIPVRVPEHRRAAAVELLTRANHGLAVGNFEFDYTDGEVRFKAVADSADGCFSADAAGRLLRHSLDACDRYHDSLMQVIYGGLSPADAVR